MQADTIQQVEADIRALAEQFKAAQADCENMMQSSLLVAHKLGQALSEAEGRMEQGQFGWLLDQVQVPKPMAKKLVKFAKETPADRLLTSSRQGMLSLGFVPQKQREKDPSDRVIHMLPHLSGAVTAWARYIRALETHQIRIDPDEARRETKEMFAWLEALHRGSIDG